MIFGVVVTTLVGLAFFLISYAIRNGNVNLIHSYHIKNVKEDDLPAYLTMFSKGMLVIGLGCLISAVFIYLENGIGISLSIILGLGLGLLIINQAQAKYNGGWFS